VHLGDLVSYRVTTRKAGYLAILDAMPDGRGLVQLQPESWTEPGEEKGKPQDAPGHAGNPKG
jgi:hypothetical protein